MFEVAAQQRLLTTASEIASKAGCAQIGHDASDRAGSASARVLSESPLRAVTRADQRTQRTAPYRIGSGRRPLVARRSPGSSYAQDHTCNNGLAQNRSIKR